MTTSVTAERRRAVTAPLGDFRVQYEWRAAALPPPHHWEYTIRIGAGGDSELVVVPDYASATAPVWRERFTVAREHMEWLYRTMLERGLLNGEWRAGTPSVGGDAEWMTVHGGGLVIEIPANVSAERRDAAATMCGAVKALVPRDVWQKIEAMRQQYVALRQAERPRYEPPDVTTPAMRGDASRGRRTLVLGVAVVLAVIVAIGVVMTALAILARIMR